MDSPTIISVHALADATQRFWHAVGQGDSRCDPRQALERPMRVTDEPPRSCGLRISPSSTPPTVPPEGYAA
ncbi:MAG: hypothetical protein CV088_10110 [Nitrospira sp. LK70]|nr:hypothetical protein [Nitrospira sp. LK70]